MERIITYTISTGESGENVLGFLRKKGFSKHILTTMKRAEQAILLNGQPAFGRTVLREGDLLRILVPEEAGDGSESSIIPVPLPLDILYEDEDILVLNKPADMPVHPSAGNYENTLANGVAWYYKQQGYHRGTGAGQEPSERGSSLRPDEAAPDPSYLSCTY